MPTLNDSRRRAGGDFEYVLQDFLELKACLGGKKTAPIKKFLFSQEPRNWSLSPVEGFCLDGHLILFQSGDPNSFKHLVFLHPDRGEIRVKMLTP